jgi:hypothetical protein
MSTWKPYLAGDREYFEQAKILSWEDGDATGGSAEYSEFQKPYLYPDDDHPTWEWSWPDNDNWPYPDITDPDPDDNPCNEEEYPGECTTAAIIGPDSLDCPTVGVYSQVHVWLGCTVAPWWAAFGTWELDSPDPEVVLVSSNPVTATVEVGDDAGDGTAVLTYYGPGCTATKEIVFTCDACCEFEITGSNTVNPGVQWVGTIKPGCAGATCGVVSNSGCSPTCTMKADGSKVYVTPGAADCGTFTVTVTKAAEGDCPEWSATIAVRINNTGQGGGWVTDTGYGANPCDPACSFGCGSITETACIDDDGFKWASGVNCVGATFLRICRGKTVDGCPTLESTKPPCATSVNCIDGGTQCVCTHWSTDKCAWICSC